MSIKLFPELISIYPASGTILLPRTELSLVLQEPQQITMVEELLKSEHRMLGVVQPLQEGDKQKVFQKGCLGKLISYHETEKGCTYITLKGVCRFHILEDMFLKNGLRKARITYEDFSQDLKESQDPFVNRKVLLNLLENYLNKNDIAADWDEIDQVSDEHLISTLTMACPFNPIEKQALLETRTLGERYDMIIALIEMATPGYKRDYSSYH